MQSTQKARTLCWNSDMGWAPSYRTMYITCLTYGWPSDDIHKDWYNAVVLCNENHIANSVFQSTLWSTQTTAITGGGAHCNPVAGVAKPVHSVPAQVMAATPFIRFAPRPPWDPNTIDVDVTCRRGPNPVVCYRCGRTGHTKPNCPEAVDICTMTAEECSDFIQYELAAMDVHTAVGLCNLSHD